MAGHWEWPNCGRSGLASGGGRRDELRRSGQGNLHSPRRRRLKIHGLRQLHGRRGRCVVRSGSIRSRRLLCLGGVLVSLLALKLVTLQIASKIGVRDAKTQFQAVHGGTREGLHIKGLARLPPISNV